MSFTVHPASIFRELYGMQLSFQNIRFSLGSIPTYGEYFYHKIWGILLPSIRNIDRVET